MFHSKPFKISVLSCIFIFLIFVTTSFANFQVVQRVPVMYKYPENNAQRNIALSLITGGSNTWIAECVVQVGKSSNGGIIPLIIFTTPDQSEELGGFIASKSYAQSLLGVNLGIVKNSSNSETLGPGIFLNYEIWKEDDQLWSYVTFENQGAGYYSECEFGCTPSSSQNLISALDEDTLIGIAATLE